MSSDSIKPHDGNLPLAGTNPSVSGLTVAIPHQPRGTCESRTKFTYEDEPVLSTQTSETFPRKLIDGFESKKEETLRRYSIGEDAKLNAEWLEKQSGKNDNYSDPFDDMAVIDTYPIRDDFNERTVTFRSTLIGLVTSVLGAAIAEVFLFKPIRISVDILFIQLICIFMGHFCAAIPGPAWWNPGPLSTKESVFSVIMATSASAGVLAAEVIAAQDVMFEKRMPAIVSIMTLLSSQLIGYGIASLLRSILVHPSRITYPGILPVVALFHSMASKTETTAKQVSLFKKAMFATSLYEILPTYLAPALSAISVWCLALPKVPAITNLFGGSLTAEGMGLLSVSGDWTLVGSHSPLVVPLLAQITDWLGVFTSILVYSAAYTKNWFGGNSLPFISYTLFDKNQNRYNLTAAVLNNGTGDSAVMEQLGPPRFSTSFVLSNAFLGMAASASVTIAVYFSIVSLLESRKEMRLHGKISKPCPHREITKTMQDFPGYAYGIVLVGAVALAFLSAHYADSGLSPLALAAALLISSILCLASGYFYGTLGINLLVTPVSQMLGGILFPGNAIGNMWFTMYGSTSVYQCVLLLKDLKLGNYMHVAPIYVVISQLIGTIIGVLIHTLVMLGLVSAQREVLLMPNGNGIFTGVHLSVMASQATAWGLFSETLFYPGKIYAIVPYFLLIGFLVPVPFLILRRFYSMGIFADFNVSLFVASLSEPVYGANAGRFTAACVGFISQFYIRKYHFKWYKKYNYIICAALDGGTKVTVMTLAFFLQGGAGLQVKIPDYFLNPPGPRDYCVLFTANTAH